MRLTDTYRSLQARVRSLFDRISLFQNPTRAGATIYLRDDVTGTTRFLGSSFAYGSRSMVLTAAHCIKDLPCDKLFICSTAEFHPERAVRVKASVVHPKADLAILKLERDCGDLRPFNHVSPPEPGREVLAHGYPEDSTPTGIHPIERHFTGVAQRVFEWSGMDAYSYDAIEVSFGSPIGLSGGSLCDYGDTAKGVRVYFLVGMMTTDRRASTYIETLTEIVENGRHHTETVHAVTKYGIAVDLSSIRLWLKANLSRQDWVNRNPS
jgi:hypothetical protein